MFNVAVSVIYHLPPVIYHLSSIIFLQKQTPQLPAPAACNQVQEPQGL